MNIILKGRLYPQWSLLLRRHHHLLPNQTFIPFTYPIMVTSRSIPRSISKNNVLSIATKKPNIYETMYYKPDLISNIKSLRVMSTFSKETGYPKKPLSFSELFRKYGLVALGVYLSLSFVVFCGCLTAITILNITAEDIDRVFTEVKKGFGRLAGTASSSSTPKNEKENQSDENDHYAEIEEKQQLSDLEQFLHRYHITNPTLIQYMTTFILAMAMTKLFSPIKLVITAMITPSVARKLQKMGFYVKKH